MNFYSLSDHTLGERCQSQFNNHVADQSNNRSSHHNVSKCQCLSAGMAGGYTIAYLKLFKYL